MSVQLKLDGRTGRGRIWKELSSCGDPVNQGVIISGKACSNCNQRPDMEKEVVRCMKCNNVFHISCLLKPITENDVKHINENPSMWWFCLNCMCVKSGDSGVTAQYSETGSVPSDVLLRTTLTTFKKDMLSLIGETIERKFQESSHSKTESICKNTSTGPNANVWGNSPPIVSFPQAEDDSISVPKQTHNTEKHVILLDPNDDTVVESVDFNKKTVQEVNKAIKSVNVNFCKVKKSGVVAIGFNDVAAKNTAMKKIQECSELSEAFTMKSPKKLLPKVTLLGINEVLFDTCVEQSRDEMKATLLADILTRNAYLKQITDCNSYDTIEVAMIQKRMPSDNVVNYSAVLKMSPSVRKAIYERGNKLYVSLSRCRVVDHYHILQCYHCQKPGHHSQHCPSKDEDATCLYCSGDHQSKMCTRKKDQCCSNCKNSANHQWKLNAHSHNAVSMECPVLKSHQEIIKNKTENWLGKK